MDANESREIIIMMFQQSVVIKGIERKLEEMRYRVTTLYEDLEDEAQRLGGRVTLMMFYLPADIIEDKAKLKAFQNVIEIIKERRQKTVLIGEDKYRFDLLREIPEVKTYPWMGRPVDMDVLEETVIKEINRQEVSDKKGRILIVDDDPSYAKIVREWTKDRYKVDIVTAGMQAISFLLKVPKDQKVDLILLDYEMPVVDGPQVLQMLKQDSVTADIPVVFLTGNSTREAVARVMELKPDGYLLKTTGKADLLEYINGILKK
ncbi:MAG: response regulator [Lachnospiraceae bacterium]|nr:response regulator [Lachnospiraceae bacterium]